MTNSSIEILCCKNNAIQSLLCSEIIHLSELSNEAIHLNELVSSMFLSREREKREIALNEYLAVKLCVQCKVKLVFSHTALQLIKN